MQHTRTLIRPRTAQPAQTSGNFTQILLLGLITLFLGILTFFQLAAELRHQDRANRVYKDRIYRAMSNLSCDYATARKWIEDSDRAEPDRLGRGKPGLFSDPGAAQP